LPKLSDALELHNRGWRVVAAPRAAKAPISSWKHAQTEAATQPELVEAFKEDRNIFVVTGRISQLAVLDCDDRTAIDYWRGRLGPILDETACVSTGKGKHFYWKLPEGEERRGRSSSGGDSGKWDIKAEGGGVVAPPSIHPSGRIYRWVAKRGPDKLQAAPAGLWATDGEEAPATGPRSLLSHLLNHRPEEGERNVWLAQVAGHYAAHIPHQDAYESMVKQAADGLGLDDAEVAKVIRSIWQTEQAKQGRAAPPEAPEGEGGEWRVREAAEESGWLVSGGTRILVRTVSKDSEGAKSHNLTEWCNADLRVLGILELPLSTIYEVEVRRLDGEIITASLASDVIADQRLLRKWLAQFGASLTNPDNMDPRGMPESTRLLRYLRAQGAPVQQTVDSLGWHEEYSAFVTHDGVLKADGAHAFEAVRPEPRIRYLAPYAYGLEGEDFEAAEILREVMTFHDERVAAVFGAWWAACFLKPQLTTEFSQFPFMALEAPSESGKSTGYFPLMLKLSGNIQGKGNPTKAALRDYLSAHRNGIVWIDDLDSLEQYGELLRNVTVEGSVTKKALNQADQITVKLHAALVVSGEALGLHSQKALLDRSVSLGVPSPVGRRSFRGSYSQWDDVVELERRHPVLSDYAGTFVVKSLKLESRLIAQIAKLRVGDGGRMNDKLTIIRIGAWMLTELMGGNAAWVMKQVDSWIDETAGAYRADDNSLTMMLLPTVLHRTGHQQRPMGPDPARKQIATPCFIRKNAASKEEIWFSPALLAAFWSDLHYAKVDARTASEQALEQQARAIGAGGKKSTGRRYWDFTTGGGGRVYWRLPAEASERVLERSRE
jgi:hypothetical protein